MGKNYLIDLQEWVAQKKGINGSSANSARVIFLAIRDDVETAIDAGYSLTTIWEHMHETGRVTTTYETFRRHVKRYINQRKPVLQTVENRAANSVKKAAKSEDHSDTKTAVTDKTPVKEEQPKPGGHQLKTFQFNPGKKRGND
ncbi:DNA-processing protein [Serratia sp. S1B]|nr:DNA-processing protein [Serratia sp. S1B]